jgi:hypothetical protein
LHGVVPRNSWGETSLFYNPGRKLPNGVYFCTIKEDDGANDTSSDLSRPGVFRVSIGVSKNTYEDKFGARPTRPAKGRIVDTGHDFALTNVLMPHPIYAWMSWVCVLSPSNGLFETLHPLIEEAHANAIVKFDKKMK